MKHSKLKVIELCLLEKRLPTKKEYQDNDLKIDELYPVYKAYLGEDHYLFRSNISNSST